PAQTRASGPTWAVLPPHRSTALQEVINQFAGGVVHLYVERFHPAGQIVEHHDGWNRHGESDGGGHQRFRNTPGNCTNTGAPPLGRNLLKRIDDTDDCSEQTDEWSG